MKAMTKQRMARPARPPRMPPAIEPAETAEVLLEAGSADMVDVTESSVLAGRLSDVPVKAPRSVEVVLLDVVLLVVLMDEEEVVVEVEVVEGGTDEEELEREVELDLTGSEERDELEGGGSLGLTKVEEEEVEVEVREGPSELDEPPGKSRLGLWRATSLCGFGLRFCKVIMVLLRKMKEVERGKEGTVKRAEKSK
jgi:hypothetical protein